MTEVNVKISKNKINFKDKKTGADSEMKVIVMEFPNGAKTNLASNRYNYRAFDYLSDLIEKGGN